MINFTKIVILSYADKNNLSEVPTTIRTEIERVLVVAALHDILYADTLHDHFT